MRIVIDLQPCQNGSRFRGIGRYAMAVTKAMLALGRGHDFRIFLTDRYPETISEIRRELEGLLPQDAISVCNLFERTTACDPDNAWRNRAAEIVRHDFIAALEPDLLFVPALFEGLWDKAVISIEQAAFPTAVTLHDLIPLEDFDLYLTKRQDQDAYLRKLRDMRHADLLLCISAFVRDEAADLVGVDPARLVTVLNGVDKSFRPAAPGKIDRADLMARMGISKPFIFNTSPLEFRKNLHGLISGFASMSRDAREGHQIVIAGGMDAHAREYLAELVRAEGLPADALVLPGRVSDEDLITLYGECALFAFPSLSEGFGLPPLEAMACGAPVITSTATSLPEVVDRADLLVDPTDAATIGAGMERILTDPALQAELRAYGPKRAGKFTWQKTAKAMLDAFEKLDARRKAAAATPAAANRPRLAFVCSTLDWDSAVAGRIASLVAELSLSHDVTLVCPESDRHDAWARAHAEVRDFDWLEYDGSRFDTILYASERSADADFAALMTNRPGLLLLLDEIGTPPVSGPVDGNMNVALQRGLYAKGGFGALADAMAGKSGAAQAWQWVGEDLIGSARATLREAEHGSLPLLGSLLAGTALREESGVTPDAPLVVAIVGGEETGAELARRFRAAETGKAELLICVAADAAEDADAEGAVHLAGNVHRLRGPLASRYRGVLSAADFLIVAADVAPALHARLKGDAEGLQLAALFDADRAKDFAPRLGAAIAAAASPTARPQPVALSAAHPSLLAWGSRIRGAAAQAGPSSRSGAAETALRSSVRGMPAHADDLARVAAALAANAALERTPRCFVDLTAFVARGRRLDPVAKAHLIALFRRGGTRIQAIVHKAGAFVVANQFVGRLLGVRDFFLPDEALVPRPGDRIVGLDLFDSFPPASHAALRAAQDRGAALLYLAAGQVPLAGGHEDRFADLLFAWAETAEPSTRRKIAALSEAQPGETGDARLNAFIEEAQKADLPVQILALDPIADAGIEAAEPTDAVRAAWAALSAASRTADKVAADTLDFAVMGHLVGSYSLALINRSVARTLDHWRPGHVRFLPYETIPIFHTEGVPAGEKALMAELSARPAPRSGEIVIAQHWPIMAPKVPHRLALSLLPWEESHVPDTIVETLNSGFDAIIAPSRSVAHALSVSGTRIPVAAIGQPVELERFLALADQRVPGKPIRRFLHVSSCFERKGVDLLLSAWAKGFTANDGVSLVIKTFPNPHNQIEAQVAALRKQHPRLAPIEVVNRDAGYEEMPDFFADADAMVLPTRGEGYNLPALEAMASGLPLIVTGHGGHRDFCGPEQARLLDYRFVRSGSHVAGDHAMWAEPNLDDLVLALRECVDPAEAEAIETRRIRALAIAKVEGDRLAWTRRFQGVVGDLLTDTDQSAPRIGWISSWQVTCGIAQYSAHLIEKMSPATQRRMTILCDHRTAHAQSLIAHDPAWTVMEGDAGDIVTGVRRNDVEALVIQHQDGLVPWEQLGWLGNDATLAGLVTVAMLHNVRTLTWKVRDEDLPMVIAGLRKMSKVLVHTMDDVNLLLSLGVDHNVGLFPHGATASADAPWPRTLRPGDAPVIGCHGFFLRHKGIDKLIRAAAILRREWPDLRLRLVNARFPNPEHAGAVDECMALARELGIEDAIEWHLDFLPTEEIEALLAGCDLIALPYDDSDDSASGAVRTALSTMVPVIATRVKIFAELGAAVGWADSNDPDVLAGAIAALLRSPAKRREIQAGMHAWLAAHDWQRMATTLENMVHGLVRQRRLGWIAPRGDTP